jgi:hypothetical protein
MEPIKDTNDVVADVKENLQETVQADDKQVIETPKQDEVFDYTKDERLNRMWVNPKTKAVDPNLMYKSIRSADDIVEKQYKPLRAQADSFNKLLKEYGYEASVEEVQKALDDSKTLKTLLSREETISLISTIIQRISQK